MVKNKSKRQHDIKNKLMAAVCMLLVSSIMMVSSTYAWFTLSTAPEVTGIQTAVGANGNLEMALQPLTGDLGAITSAAGDSVRGVVERNVTWGNLVELADTNGVNQYGLDKITLFPAALNLDAAGKLNTGSMLKTPTYGSDGRVSELIANTVTSYYSNTEGFVENDDYGVRAVGVASGMTDRQLDYRNARAAANTAASQAKNAASLSLNTNGSTLANIAIKYGTSGDTATFNQDDVNALEAIVADLEGTATTSGVLSYIETAYIQSILAYAASAESDDTKWTGVKAAVNAPNASLSSVITAIGGETVLPEALKTAIDKYNTTVTNVSDASTALSALTGDTITWAEIKVPLQKLADPTAMEVNGIKASEIKQGDNMSTLVNSVTSGGLVVAMKTGGGVYADVADQCGDYPASISIQEVTYNGLTLHNVDAKMNTISSVTPSYLTAIATAVEAAGAPSSGTDKKMPITDMYGYVVDLAFRTNAAESNLKLQVEAADRIYSDNSNEQTMGHGSSMTFASTTNDFSNENVKQLMGAIRLVFFNTMDGTVYVNGKLDTANATIGADGVTAKIQLYTGSAENTAAENYVKVSDGTGTHKQVAIEEYKQIEASESYTGTKYTQSGTEGNYTYTEDENGTYKKVVTGYDYVELTADEKLNYTGDRYKLVTGAAIKSDNVIMPLLQNTATPMSVLVYLDGNNMGNDDVAATAATSMTGKMNIQFASSATLVPMEYADLHVASADSVKVTVPTGVTGAEKATKNVAYSFTVANGYTLTEVKVGGTAITLPTLTDGKYTIPAASVTGDIVITVTAAAAG